MIWPAIWPFVLAVVLKHFRSGRFGLSMFRGGEAHDCACRCEACAPTFTPWLDRWVRIR